jgi:hypothetical protein
LLNSISFHSTFKYDAQDEGFHDHAVTMLLVAWGQYLDHDITLTGETKDGAGKTPKCCQDGIGARAHPECMPIDIPHNDGFYAQYGRKCLNFVRNLVSANVHVPILQGQCYEIFWAIWDLLDLSLTG